MPKITIRVYKDTFTPSRPWNADVIWPDGKVWKGWQSGWKTRTKMLENSQGSRTGKAGNLMLTLFRRF